MTSCSTQVVHSGAIKLANIDLEILSDLIKLHFYAKDNMAMRFK